MGFNVLDLVWLYRCLPKGSLDRRNLCVSIGHGDADSAPILID
jgi:hypothetical protein